MDAIDTMPAAGISLAPTADDLVAKAEELAPTLVERQAETEQRTFYAPDTHEEFSRAGFYRILVPRRFGGWELGLDTHLRVVTALARGCPSTAWMYTFGAYHAHLAATLFGEQAQAELFDGGDFICPATVAPSGTAETTDDGGWLISGTHSYCSGVPYATHFIGHALLPQGEDEPPVPVVFVAPRSQWRQLDDWGDQLGLKGSGSHSVVLENASVPAHYALPGMHLSQVDVTAGTEGRQLHGAEYGGGVLSSLLFQLGALALGMAKGALDAYEDLMQTRMTIFPPIATRTHDPDYQFHYGEATALLATAEAALQSAVAQWSDTARRGPEAFTREVDLRLSTISREVVRLSWRAVSEQLYPTAGSSSVRHGERIERVWRDMSTLHSHAALAIFLNTVANRELARNRFGITD